MNLQENIKTLEKKLMELNSLTNIKPELENKIEKISEINQNVSYSQDNHSIDRSYLNTSLKNKNIRSELNYQDEKESIKPKKMQKSMSYIKNENDNDDDLERILEENERLKEGLREKKMKIETMNFRCEKLQSELAQKLNLINRLSLEMNEIKTSNEFLLKQKEYLESLVDDNNKNLLPEHQKLKSKYEISVLEIKSLENDNKILEGKLLDYINMHKSLKSENKELSLKTSKMEIEKLEIKKDVEMIKSIISQNEYENKELIESNTNLESENERLKNQIFFLNNKLKILNENNHQNNNNDVNIEKTNVSKQNLERASKDSNQRKEVKKIKDSQKLNFEELNFFDKKINNFSYSKNF
jgi:hypothetical protein